jgi:signal transduction histidine kinase
VDGRLWFSTSRGLATVNPREVESNPLPPPVLIEAMYWNDQILSPEAGKTTPIEIPPGRHRFEFHYTGLSFIGPEKMRFKYRLRGIDKDWVNAVNTRSARYSYVPPGQYTFEVQGCNSDGVWNRNPAQVAFVVKPFYWQTMWFLSGAGGLCVAMAGAIGWFLTRQRMRRKLAQMKQQHAIEHERARIANDIHDDLGAQLTRITMLSDSARDETSDPAQVIDGLNQIYSTAREATRAMDEIVWAVNPKHDTIESLANYLEKFGFDYLDSATIRCRLDFPGCLPPRCLTTEMRHNLFLAYKEALHNVVKHADATEVRITFSIQNLELELTVEDNGKGFGLNNVENNVTSDRGTGRLATGHGLENMNRRVCSLGGTCQVQSDPGRGTKVIFRLKLNTLTAVS